MQHDALPLEEKCSVSDETVYCLRDLIPEAITANLWNYFNEFMLTKLKIAKILPPVDLSEGEQEEWLTSQYKTLEKLVSQFSREMKPVLLNLFVEIVQYARSFGLYCPYFQEEIQQLANDSSVSGYKAVIAAMLEHIPANQPAVNGKRYLGRYLHLQGFISELQQCYDSLHHQAHKQLDQVEANSLITIEKRFNDPLEATTECLLSRVLASSDPVSLTISSAQAVAAQEVDSPQAKKQQYYIRKYEESLRPLDRIEASKKIYFYLR